MMEIDDFLESNFEDINLFRTICELTQELEDMDDCDESPIQKVNPDDFLNCAGIAIATTPQKPGVERQETLQTFPEQKKDRPGEHQPRDELALNIPSEEITPCTAEAGLAESNELKESSKRKRSARKPRSYASYTSSIQSDESSRRYNLRRRTEPVYYGLGKEPASPASRYGTPPVTRSRSKSIVAQIPEKIAERECSEPHISASQVAAKVRTKRRSPGRTEAVGRAWAKVSVERKGDSHLIKTNWTQEVASARLDFDGDSMTLCGRSESSYCSRVESCSTVVDARVWNQQDWENFFDIFSALAAEVQTVRGMKSKKTEACRRWLSCMRNILERPPV